MGRTVGRADSQAATRLHGVSPGVFPDGSCRGDGIDGGQEVRGMEEMVERTVMVEEVVMVEGVEWRWRRGAGVFGQR